MNRTALVSILGAVLAACTGSDRPQGPGAPGVIAVAGDFTAGHPGVLSTADPVSLVVAANAGPAMAVGDDPVVRHIGGELFIINRGDGNNVTIVDDDTLALKEQLGTGAGSNPQDIAVVGAKLYVPTFGTKGVTVLTRGQTSTRTIDLSADDPDGKPNCNSIYLVGTDLYVSCELLDDMKELKPPRGPGKVYVIDSGSDQVRTVLTLGHQNPIGVFEQVPAEAPHGGELVIPTVFFDDGSGCVERIVPGAAPTAPGCLLDNTALGGFASRVAFQVAGGTTMMWSAVPASDFVHANLRGYDLGTSALWESPINPPAQVIGDIAVCPDGLIAVADTTKDANGLRIYDGATEKTTAVLPIGLPPSSTHGLVCY